MKRRIAFASLALAIFIVGASTGAWADGAGAPNTAAVTTIDATANIKPRFYGFTFDLTTADGSGLNSAGHNYRNDFVWYFEPAWNIGQHVPARHALAVAPAAGSLLPDRQRLGHGRGELQRQLERHPARQLPRHHH